MLINEATTDGVPEEESKWDRFWSVKGLWSEELRGVVVLV
jgi:hypothetical protein